MGIPENHPSIIEATKRGLIPPGAAPAPKGRRGKVALVEAAHVPGSATWVIPLETASEINLTVWQHRNRRTKGAWKAVRKAVKNWELVIFETNVEWGRPVHATLTRLGGKKLDRGNLPSALKAVEDSICYLIGVDDGSPLWVASCEQIPGGPMGVRIELR